MTGAEQRIHRLDTAPHATSAGQSFSPGFAPWRLGGLAALPSYMNDLSLVSLVSLLAYEAMLMLSLNRAGRPSRSLIPMVGRMLLGPLAIGVLAGLMTAGRGAGFATLAGYLSFLAAQTAVRFWSRWQLHRARVRLATARARAASLPRRR